MGRRDRRRAAGGLGSAEKARDVMGGKSSGSSPVSRGSRRPPARELFAAEAPDGCALAYRNLIRPQHPGAVAARQRCEEMWRVFQPLADRNFPREFPCKLHQRWFEMYLGASFISAGLEVRAPKPGPDFEILSNGRRIYVEAVCATSGHPLHADAAEIVKPVVALIYFLKLQVSV